MYATLQGGPVNWLPKGCIQTLQLAGSVFVYLSRCIFLAAPNHSIHNAPEYLKLGKESPKDSA